jgi:Zn-finger nucleic acid-binding protein
MTDRQGVEIDYCPKCRGVWLDRGELDKIIERSAGSPQQQQHSPDTRYEERSHYPKHDEHSYGHKKKKKEGFLSDLFDF